MNHLDIKIKYEKDDPELKLQQISVGNWIDLKAAETVELKQFESGLISLGVSMELPKGYEAYIVPRSSTFKKWGILQTNHFGIVDNSYCGNNDIWRFSAFATRDTIIHKGDRICQFRIHKTMQEEIGEVDIVEVSDLENEDRGGFGSTGTREYKEHKGICPNNRNVNDVPFECLAENCNNCYDDDGALYCKLAFINNHYDSKRNKYE